jgi:hypothetical protein
MNLVKIYNTYKKLVTFNSQYYPSFQYNIVNWQPKFPAKNYAALNMLIWLTKIQPAKLDWETEDRVPVSEKPSISFDLKNLINLNYTNNDIYLKNTLSDKSSNSNRFIDLYKLELLNLNYQELKTKINFNILNNGDWTQYINELVDMYRFLYYLLDNNITEIFINMFKNIIILNDCNRCLLSEYKVYFSVNHNDQSYPLNLLYIFYILLIKLIEKHEMNFEIIENFDSAILNTMRNIYNVKYIFDYLCYKYIKFMESNYNLYFIKIQLINCTFLMYAVKCNAENIVQYLYNEMILIKQLPTNPITKTIMNNVDDNNKTELMIAIDNNNINIVKILIAKDKFKELYKQKEKKIEDYRSILLLFFKYKIIFNQIYTSFMNQDQKLELTYSLLVANEQKIKDSITSLLKILPANSVLLNLQQFYNDLINEIKCYLPLADSSEYHEQTWQLSEKISNKFYVMMRLNADNEETQKFSHLYDLIESYKTKYIDLFKDIKDKTRIVNNYYNNIEVYDPSNLDNFTKLDNDKYLYYINYVHNKISPLYYAVQKESVEIVELLINNGAIHMREDHELLIYEALKTKNYNIIKLIYDNTFIEFISIDSGKYYTDLIKELVSACKDSRVNELFIL